MNKTFDSHWINRNILDQNKSDIDQNLYDWLVLPKNLTETIKKTGAQFSLTLLSQSFDEPYSDEHAILRDYLADASCSFVRKVLLNGDNQSIVFSRVIIPKHTYFNYENEFTHLGNSSIGNTILYLNKNIERTAFEFKCIDRSDPVFQELTLLNHLSKKKCFGARRSVFTLPKGSLLISEIFLDSLPVYPQ